MSYLRFALRAASVLALAASCAPLPAGGAAPVPASAPLPGGTSGLLALGAAKASPSPAAPPGDARLTNGTLTIGTSARYAGAIASLVYGGKEYVNNYDHGRQIQVAWQVDGWGEALNPTEAGSRGDGATGPSSSRLEAFGASATALESVSRPAYWLHPGEATLFGPAAPLPTTAQNRAVLSDDRIEKRLTLGYGGDPGVLELGLTVRTAAAAKKLRFEAPTGYLGAEFASHYRFDPAGGTLTPLPAQGVPGVPTASLFANGVKDPVIVATADGKYALGVWSPEMAGFLGYASARQTGGGPGEAAAKWSAVYERQNVPAGAVTLGAYLAAGSLSQVQASLKALYRAKLPALVAQAAGFDAKAYLARYPDLTAAGIRTAEEARWHWINYGHAEGRVGKP